MSCSEISKENPYKNQMNFHTFHFFLTESGLPHCGIPLDKQICIALFYNIKGPEAYIAYLFIF